MAPAAAAGAWIVEVLDSKISSNQGLTGPGDVSMIPSS